MILSGDLPSISPPAQRDRHDGQHLPHGAGEISDNYHCLSSTYHESCTSSCSIYLTVLEKYQTIFIVVALIVCLCVIIIKLSGWEDA